MKRELVYRPTLPSVCHHSDFHLKRASRGIPCCLRLERGLTFDARQIVGEICSYPTLGHLSCLCSCIKHPSTPNLSVNIYIANLLCFEDSLCTRLSSKDELSSAFRFTESYRVFVPTTLFVSAVLHSTTNSYHPQFSTFFLVFLRSLLLPFPQDLHSRSQ
jgi:hypothetical protein